MSLHQDNLILKASDLDGLPRHLQLKKSGEYLRAGCPFHGSDRSRSLSINARTGRFHCFVCEAWGYTEAARERYQKDRAGTQTAKPTKPTKPIAMLRISDPPAPLDDAMLRILERWQGRLEDSAAYLASRAIPLDVARRHGVGFCPPGEVFAGSIRGPRIVVPHTDVAGRCVSLYSRSTVEETPLRHCHLRRPKGIFNAHAMRKEGGPLFVCEGAFDALALLTRGFRAVAIFGLTGWRWEWCDEREIVLALDADASADSAVEEFSRQALISGARLMRLTADELGGCKDVSEAHTRGVLRIDLPSSPLPKRCLKVAQNPPRGFAEHEWGEFVALCGRHHRGADTWSDAELYSLPPSARHPLGAGALWLAVGSKTHDLAFTETEVRFGNFRLQRKNLKPSGSLPQRV